MESFLALGFLIGMQHALEADHLAAVGTMADGHHGGKRGLALRGAVWGLGHTMTLCTAERHAKWLHSGLALGVAALAVGIGVDVMAETAATAWGGL